MGTVGSKLTKVPVRLDGVTLSLWTWRGHEQID